MILPNLDLNIIMNDLAAAIGIGNLADFPQRLARRQQIAACYRKKLQGVSGIELLRTKTIEHMLIGFLLCWLSEEKTSFESYLDKKSMLQ